MLAGAKANLQRTHHPFNSPTFIARRCARPQLFLTGFFVGASGGVVVECRVDQGYISVVLVKTAPSFAGVAVVEPASVDQHVGLLNLTNQFGFLNYEETGNKVFSRAMFVFVIFLSWIARVRS